MVSPDLTESARVRKWCVRQDSLKNYEIQIIHRVLGRVHSFQHRIDCGPALGRLAFHSQIVVAHEQEFPKKSTVED